MATFAFSVLTLLVGQQDGHLACKKWGDDAGGHWLVRMEWHQAGWSVCVSLNLPLHHKVQKFLLAPAHPGGPGKRVVKMVVCVCVCACQSLPDPGILLQQCVSILK